MLGIQFFIFERVAGLLAVEPSAQPFPHDLPVPLLMAGWGELRRAGEHKLNLEAYETGHEEGKIPVSPES